jgi:tyrosyl-tRNA synthetase
MFDELLTRGVEAIYPNKEFLEKKLAGGKPISIYLGIDPTGPTLHLGHATVLNKLKKFQELGHKVILLIGDFTATIGDPDKLSVRVPLSKEQVHKNAKLYKKQASIFLKFSGKNKAELVYNSAWLAKMRFEEILNVLSKTTVDQILKREMFQRRVAENRPIYLHEFLYPVMQGYDSVVLDVDGEIGGNDQTFNMLTGRALMKELLGKEKFVMTMKLLVDPDGKKMGKTEGNMITLTDSPAEMFGKVMSWSDGMIVSAFELCTDVDTHKIDNIKKELVTGANPRDIKMRLAREIVTVYHGEKEAKKAEEDFVDTFSKGGVPDEMPGVTVSPGAALADVLLGQKIIKSKTDWRRLIKDGAVNIVSHGDYGPNGDSNQKITDPLFVVMKTATFKVGKRRFIKVLVK